MITKAEITKERDCQPSWTNSSIPIYSIEDKETKGTFTIDEWKLKIYKGELYTEISIESDLLLSKNREFFAFKTNCNINIILGNLALAAHEKRDYTIFDVFNDIFKLHETMNVFCSRFSEINTDNSSSTSYQFALTIESRKYDTTKTIYIISSSENRKENTYISKPDYLYDLISDIINIGVENAYYNLIRKMKKRDMIICFDKISDVVDLNGAESRYIEDGEIQFMVNTSLKKEIREEIERNQIYNIQNTDMDVSKRIITIEYLSEV